MGSSLNEENIKISANTFIKEVQLIPIDYTMIPLRVRRTDDTSSEYAINFYYGYHPDYWYWKWYKYYLILFTS